jgi:hypothetical protein
MTKVRKHFSFLISAIFVGLLGFIAAPRDAAQGVTLGRTLYVGQSVLDNLHYRFLIIGTLRGHAGALESLVNVDCGGGAGCYDHGEVLVQLLNRVGDAKFVSMVKESSIKSKFRRASLLAAGFEYGSSVKASESEVRFPMTARVLTPPPKPSPLTPVQYN